MSSLFNRWIRKQGLGEYLQDLPYSSESIEIPDEPGGSEAFHREKGQVVLPEVPFKSRVDDRLGFADYADVLAKRLQNPTGWPLGIGIYAQWGAGKSSLCEMIIERLEDSGPKVKTPWFIRWLWTTTCGAALYALTVGFITAISGKLCINTNGGNRPAPPNADNMERGAGTSTSSDSKSPRIISIIARFDAWLFADSKVLWAVLVSKVFEEVEECFGKGAVRATRVQHAVLSSTCMDWCTAVFTLIVVVCVAAAVAWIVEQIELLEKEAERAVSGIALLGVPLGIVLWMIKALPVVFESQGQIILSKAEAMGESVGTAHLGFMADVQEEMQVLLGMLKSKSSEEKKYLLVISIDNLDRCPHRQIVKVLEAVHLLLEYIEVNVAVILALDPRMVVAAVEKDMGDEMCREVSGSEYLDKIIHWPFCIPANTKEERTSLLYSWLRRSFHQTPAVRDDDGANTREGPVGEAGRPSSETGRHGSRSTTTGDADAKTSEASVLDDGKPQSSPGRHTSPTVPPEEAGDVRDNAASPSSEAAASGRDQVSQDDSLSHLGRQTTYLAHTLDEVEEMENMITKFATTPRKAKRVFNMSVRDQ